MITAAKVEFARVQLELWNCLRRPFISGMFNVEKAVSRLITNSVALMMVFPTLICDKALHSVQLQDAKVRRTKLVFAVIVGAGML